MAYSSKGDIPVHGPLDKMGEMNLSAIRAAEEGRFSEALEILRAALRVEPGNSDTLNNLGKVLYDAGDYAGALSVCIEGAKKHPAEARFWRNAAKCFGEMGEPARAVSAIKKALSIEPSSADIWSDYLFLLNYSGASRESVFLEHLSYGRKFGGIVRPAAAAGRTKGKFRIGYVSADFREHPVAYLFEPVISNHDRSKFEILCYSNRAEKEDGIGKRIREAADGWRDIFSLSDKEAQTRILEDNVDVLVDLSGHTGGNRLGVFAMRAAPVQASWLGYLNTTGLPNMDYHIADELVLPKMNERFYSEKIVRMKKYLAFGHSEHCGAVGPLPQKRNGYVTFGSFNNWRKVSHHILDVWAKVLKTVPDSRMIIVSGGDGKWQKTVLDEMVSRGIDKVLVKVLSRVPLDEYFRLHNEIDLLLDTHPYSGGLTVLHGLSMGVPSVTLEGESEYSRNGSAIMRHAGFSDFVARDIDEYFKKAVSLSQNGKVLENIRAEGRKSVSGDAKEVVADLENAYIGMIGEKGSGTASPDV